MPYRRRRTYRRTYRRRGYRRPLRRRSAYRTGLRRRSLRVTRTQARVLRFVASDYAGGIRAVNHATWSLSGSTAATNAFSASRWNFTRDCLVSLTVKVWPSAYLNADGAPLECVLGFSISHQGYQAGAEANPPAGFPGAEPITSSERDSVRTLGTRLLRVPAFNKGAAVPGESYHRTVKPFRVKTGDSIWIRRYLVHDGSNADVRCQAAETLFLTAKTDALNLSGDSSSAVVAKIVAPTTQTGTFTPGGIVLLSDTASSA